MKATATRAERVSATSSRSASHQLIVDEPQDSGRRRHRPRARRSCSPPASPPAPRSRWRCTPSARAGTSAASRSTASTRPAERGCPTRFQLVMRLPDDLTEEQVERLQVIAAKCPVHRTLEGEVDVRRACRARLARPLRRAPPRCRAGVLLDPVAGRRRSTSSAAPTPPCSSRSTSTPTARCTPSSPAAATTCAATRARSRSRAGAGPERRRPARRPRCARPTRRSACRPSAVELVGALQPTPTIATDYAVYPFVGLIEPGSAWAPSPTRGRPRCSSSRSRRCADGLRRRRLLRRGVPFRTDTYVVGERPHLGRDGPDRSPTCSTAAARLA